MSIKSLVIAVAMAASTLGLADRADAQWWRRGAVYYNYPTYTYSYSSYPAYTYSYPTYSSSSYSGISSPQQGWGSFNMGDHTRGEFVLGLSYLFH